ncbi:hypothetical protein DL98DRAFT_643447 [Cadophora sp. DSE1049]|nr:hypothetical protein DL98DRAFT_643447 [Cadophora sp. DSE1049]
MLDVSHKKADKVHRAVGRIKGVFKSRQRTKAHHYLTLEDNLPRQRSLEDAIIFSDHAAKIAAKLSGRVVQVTLHGERDRKGVEIDGMVASVKGKGKQRAPIQDESTFNIQPTSFAPGPSRTRSSIPQPSRTAPNAPDSLLPRAPPTPEDSLVATPTTSHDIPREGESSISAPNKAPPLSRNPYSDENYPKFAGIPMATTL